MSDYRKGTKASSLYATISHLSDEEECCRFFKDLCTPIELRSMEQRFQVGMCLFRDLPYSEVKKETGASSATISRVRRAMLDNGAGGIMREILEREGFDSEV